MTKEKLEYAKSLYDNINKIVSDESFNILFHEQSPDSKYDFDQLFMVNMLEYMYCISNADGRFSDLEVQLINFITGCKFTKNDFVDIFKERVLYEYSDNYVPRLIEMFCAIENEIVKARKDYKMCVLNYCVELFTVIGEIIADSDNSITSGEMNRILEIRNNIVKYCTENTLSPYFEA